MTDEVISHIADSFHSIVGEGTCFRGDFNVKGLLRIDGDFIGTIETTGKVLVSKNGRADCTINCKIVVIGGIVKGNIFAAQSVEILSSGIVIGTIVTPRLIVHEDVIFHGSCRVAPETGASPERMFRIEERPAHHGDRHSQQVDLEQERIKESIAQY